MKMLLAVLSCAALTAGAQKAPPIRQIGRLERVTTDSLGSVRLAIPMQHGSVLVHDGKNRRVLLFDSTLAHALVVADTTDKTNSAYGRSLGELIPYRGDSALFVDVGGLSMMVIDPSGKLGRVMAIPRADDAQRMLDVFGLPGFDGSGRIIYSVSNRDQGHRVACCVEHPGRLPQYRAGSHPIPKADSVQLIRIDLATRALDTIASVKVEIDMQRFVTDDDGVIQSLEWLTAPLQTVDSWTVMSDGTLAIVRGRDLHVDFFGADGRWTSSPKLPFDWERVDDTRKLALIDSGTKALQERAGRAAVSSAGGGRGAVGGRGGGGAAAAGGRGAMTRIPDVVVRPNQADVADYVPAIDEHSVSADAENNLWIRTSTRVDGRPVYDVVNRRGEMVDRVQLPAFRTIAGFGAGVIYMAVADGTGQVRLERARVR
jgi:hypothetical protein